MTYAKSAMSGTNWEWFLKRSNGIMSGSVCILFVKKCSDEYFCVF